VEEEEMPRYQVGIIGSGPAGYVAAIRAASLGLKVCVVEQGQLGGVCMNVGCIPTKLMIRSTEVFSLSKHASEYGVKTGDVSFDWPAIIARKDKTVDLLRRGIAGLFKSRGVHLVTGRARLAGRGRIQVAAADGTTGVVEADHIVLATGSAPVEIAAFKFDGRRILTSDDVTRLPAVPSSILIVGGGYIGCEFAVMLAELGVKVALVEMLDHLLMNADEDLAKMALRILKKLKVDVRLSTTVEQIDVREKDVVARTSDGKSMEAEVALVAVGRRPLSADLGLDVVGAEVDRRGAVQIDAQCRTNVERLYAVGDVTGKILLAHVGSRQGLVAVEHVAGKPEARIDYGLVPGVIFMHPELATVGLSEAEARQKVAKVKVARFNQQILGRDQAEGPAGGFVKIVGDEATGEVLGVHVVGHRATDLIHEAVLAMTSELLVDDFAAALHAHPTFSEGFQEAADLWLGRPIHAQ
jgi:dihydrolipoamide dehydrogenase